LAISDEEENLLTIDEKYYIWSLGEQNTILNFNLSHRKKPSAFFQNTIQPKIVSQ
jgi:hypothetical protein